MSSAYEGQNVFTREVMERFMPKYTLERYESTRGRTTPEVEWRVWNTDHTYYTPFKTKREAVAYMAVMNSIKET